MKMLVGAVRDAITAENYYAALALALTLPDICAGIESESGKSTWRSYIDWWEQYLGPNYRRKIGPEQEEHIFMRGGDCYALRCAFLHEGRDDIGTQRAKDILDRFRFVQPKHGGVIHCNQVISEIQPG